MGLNGFDAVAFDVDAGSGVASETWRSPDGCGDWYPAAAPLGGGFVAAVQSWRRSPELVSVRDGSDRVLARTEHPGHDVVRGAVASRERVAWNGADDLEIQGLLTLPHGEAPFPLIVDVHGGPVWAYQDAFPGAGEALFLSRGYALFQPNPRGSGGRGRDFAAKVVGDMGGADAHDLLRGVDALVERGVADPERIGVVGGSYGGYMACWLPVLDQRFKASVSVSPVTDWYSERFASSLGTWAEDFLGGSPKEAREAYDERSPVLKIDRVVTPTLLTAGLKDRATPRGQAVEFYRALRAKDVATEVVVYGDEGHGVRSFPGVIDLQTRALAWFERFMPAR
jgi:dipeptidyl aminopeptidase/acylaminoacyl peptidase